MVSLFFSTVRRTTRARQSAGDASNTHHQLVPVTAVDADHVSRDEGLEWRDAELIDCRAAGDRDPEQLYRDVDMYSLGTDELVIDQEIDVYDSGGVVQRAEPDSERASYAIGRSASFNSGFTLLEVIDIKLEWILARPTVPLLAEELLRFPAGYRDFA
ncbi:hypothetical protein WOLCODRAFT_24455 [Wolfiporia cocos MD-104 SS10]|uniref:Uncharacterized protein n=1 Tax=Wolfiporia cocos (strain MD-104) TaxID=742152 RepID=A0A2H3JFU0_WOLCO|nr:hypothetical protein WOLCODRAFT_24455 [Wolfiporia cocos MD-104 SS10]